MRAVLRIVAAMVALACAGCGGGGGDGGSVAGGKIGTGETVRVPGITLVAGDAVASGAADGAGAAARFNVPRGIVVDSAGNLYVADQFNSAIRKITPAGAVSTFVGVLGEFGMVDGIGAAARLQRPVGLAIDASGNLYVTDSDKVRKVSPSGLVTTIATIPWGEMVDARSAAMFVPGAIAVDASGNLYLTNGIGTHKISAGGTTIVEGVATMDNVFGTKSLIPRGVAVDGAGTVYVADLQQAISKLGSDGKLAGFVGTPGKTGSSDGSGAGASFWNVFALAADAGGNLYAADNGNNLIRKITPAGAVTTVAGTRGSAELQTGSLPGSLAAVSGVAVDKSGNLFATSGNAVVKVVPGQ